MAQSGRNPDQLTRMNTWLGLEGHLPFCHPQEERFACDLFRLSALLRERALKIKAALRLDPKVEFVMVTGAYIRWGIE